MVVGDKIRLIENTTFHSVGDEGVIVEIDKYHQHCIVVKFPGHKKHSLFPLAGHCASLLNCDIKCCYEVI